MSGRALLLIMLGFPAAGVLGFAFLRPVNLLDSLFSLLVVCFVLFMFGSRVAVHVEVNDTDLVIDTLFRKLCVPWTAVKSLGREFSGQRLSITVENHWGTFYVMRPFIRDFKSVVPVIERQYASTRS